MDQVKRLISLDVFRGATIILMILVNNPGSWIYIYSPLRHAEWHGWTPTDMVFPFFLFIVGVAISLSFAKRIESGALKSDLIKKLFSRTLIIFGIGLFLNAYPFGLPLDYHSLQSFKFNDIIEHLETLRILGVLQRIALCYFFAGLIFIQFPKLKHLIVSLVALFCLYEFFMRIPLVYSWGNGSFDVQQNFIRFFDLKIFGEAHLYRENGIPFDPEGLISTITAIATTIFGIITGELIRTPGSQIIKIRNIALLGIAFLILGEIAGIIEPINKKLWTVSYTILMAGWAMFILAVASWIIDIRNWTKWVKPFIYYGSNPLAAFVGSGFLAKNLYLIKFTDSEGTLISVKTWLYQSVFQHVGGDYFGSLLHALAHIIFWLLITWWLYHKKIFIKI